MKTPELDSLLQAAGTPAAPVIAKDAEEAFFNALIDCIVYANVPVEPTPSNRMRFVQFIRSGNGPVILPQVN